MKDYVALLEAAKHDPSKADFSKLRKAYTNSPDYTPLYLPADKYSAIGTALENNEIEQALRLLEEIFESHYLDIQAHAFASVAYKRGGNEQMAQYHRQFTVGLLDSIFNSGNGATPETSFVVIDLSEEMALLFALNAQVLHQEVLEHEGHRFHLLLVRFISTGDEAALYVNLDLIPHGEERGA